MAITAAVVAAARTDLAGAGPEEMIRWAVDRFDPRVGLTCSFSGAGVVLVHLLSRVAPHVPVIFLDTSFHFPETLAFRDQVVERYGVRLLTLQPLITAAEQAERHGDRLFATNPDRCCQIRKVEPMARALEGLDAWITALRRDQSETRAAVECLEYHETPDGRPVVKVLPLASWSRAEVFQYMKDHQIPTHPLLDQGYKSIGCWPCTRPVGAGEAERAGRWAGQMKTECGLHTFTQRVR